MLETLRDLGVPNELMESMVTVGNKMDLIEPEKWPDLKKEGLMPVSATEGFGIMPLAKLIERKILEGTGRREMKVKVRTGSEDMAWVSQNFTMSNNEVDPKDENYSILSLITTEAEMGMIKKHFRLS